MRILVTGTDTNVGKTWVACALAHALRREGKSVIAVKPVETGCSDPPTVREDGVLLAHATGQTQPAHAIIRLSEPAAPVLAADGSNTAIDFDALLLKIERYTKQAEFLLIEGVGGLLTPITWEWNMTDVARALDASALVVAVDRLGTINHTLLTLSALELAGIHCLGVVLTAPGGKDRSATASAAAVSRLSGIERVTVVSRSADPRDAGDSMAAVMSWAGRVGITG
jgi:dethiobiotin synthetase